MKSHSWIALVLTLSLGMAETSSVLAAEEPPLVVRVQSGESFCGNLGPESDGERLDLVVERKSITLTRSIPWDVVLNVSEHGQEVSVAELRQRVGREVRRRRGNLS